MACLPLAPVPLAPEVAPDVGCAVGCPEADTLVEACCDGRAAAVTGLAGCEALNVSDVAELPVPLVPGED